MHDNNFTSLGLQEHFLTNLQALGYTQMTPIQAASLPFIIEGKDLLAQAKTGSGKTLAFSLGLLSRLNSEKYAVQAMVLCPTRELADQVAKVIRSVARALENIKVLSLCGGTPFGPQLNSLRHGAHIVVGTPGRVLDHLQRGSLVLDSLHMLVLDEADRMLEMGFIEGIEAIISHMPSKRQTLLFSATYPSSVENLAQKIQTDAHQIALENTEGANPIDEHFYASSMEEKEHNLLNILAHYRPSRSIIFTATKRGADDLAQFLRHKGVDALAIHGDLQQYERIDVWVQFANESCSVLVATDLAARGLDIQALPMVINFDLPRDYATYTHRIGRTGRAGEKGLAVSLFTPSDVMEEYISQKINVEETASLPKVTRCELQPPFKTLVIEGGKKQKVRPGDLLGALTGEAGLPGESVGKIDIFDRQAYVAIKRDHAYKALEKLKKGKIKGKKFSVWILE